LSLSEVSVLPTPDILSEYLPLPSRYRLQVLQPPVRINKRLLKSHCRQDVHIPVESVSESAWLRYRSVPYTPPSYKNPSYSDGYFLFLLHLYYYSYYCPFLPVIHLHNRITDIGLFVNTHFSFIFYSQIVAALWSVLYQRLFFCNHDADENAF